MQDSGSMQATRGTAWGIGMKIAFLLPRPNSYSSGTSTGQTPAHSLRQPLQSFSSTNLAFLTPETVNLPTDPSMFRISA